MKKVVLFALIAILAVSAVSAVEYRSFRDVYRSSVARGSDYLKPSSLGNVGYYKYSNHTGPVMKPDDTSFSQNMTRFADDKDAVVASKINTRVQVPRRQQGSFLGRLYRFVSFSELTQR